GASSGRGDPAVEVRRRVDAARARLAGAIHAAGLDEFAQAARVHLGAEPESPDRPPLELLEPAAPVQVRRLGRPQHFRGESRAGPRPMILWSAASPQGLLEPGEAGLALAGAVVAPAVVLVVVRRGERARRWGAAALAAALLALAAAAGPLLL